MYAARFDTETRVKVSKILIEDPALTPEGLNEIAWVLALDAAATPQGLEVAREAAGRATEKAPTETTFMDTLATVAFREGAVDDAVTLERKALEQDGAALRASATSRVALRFLLRGQEEGMTAGSPFYASQLSRFLAERLKKQGPILPVGMASPLLAVVPPASNAATGALSSAVLTLARGEPDGLTLYALAYKADVLLGLIRISVGVKGGERYEIELPQPASDALTSNRLSLEVAIVERRPVDTLPNGTATLRYWAHDKEVDQLP